MSAKNSSDLTKGHTAKQYRDMVKRLERFKKFVSITAIILMGTAMLFNIVTYGMLI
jgi:predicted lysophospholipase L1 biosynthesis ABC-type transport system permease subunit